MCDTSRPRVSGRDIALDHPKLLDLLRLFHGHVGPYVVLGYRIGLRAREVLGAGKYFGMRVSVSGPKRTPYTCLVDGLQMATGCTMGKCNIVLEEDEPRSGTLFELAFRTDDGAFNVSVPGEVKELFAGWMQTEPTEEEIFERTCSQPAKALWREDVGEGA